MLDFIRLNELLKEKGIKKSYIADRLGKTRSLLNDWEKGKSQPSEAALQTIADILDTTAAYLIGESDQKEKEAAPEGQPLSEDDIKMIQFIKGLTDLEKEKLLDYANYIKSQRNP